MTSVVIDIDEEILSFILSGNIESLLNLPRKRLYLQDFLKANLENNTIKIPYDGLEKEEKLRTIQEFLSDNGVDQIRSLRVEELFAAYVQEDRNFFEFSGQAKSIRNNNLSPDQKNEFGNFIKTLSIALPGRSLYQLQLLSAYHLAFSQNACNFSVPGSGKTSIVYGAYAYLRSLPKENPKHVDYLAIIGPLSSFAPWENEYFECFGKKPSSARLAGGAKESLRSRQFYGANPCEIMLLSYNSIPFISKDLISFLKAHRTMVVLDEAHKIKNISGGVWANSVLELSRFCVSRVVLTGTPAPNGYEDLFNLFKFIWPTKDVITFYPYQLLEMSEKIHDSRIPTLINEIEPFFLRIRKSDLKLPKPLNHSPIYIEMGAIQKEIYQFIEKKCIGNIQSQLSSSSNVHDLLRKAKLVRLMQASINPALLSKPLEEYYIQESWSDDIRIDDKDILGKIINYKNLETPPKFIAAKELIKSIISQGRKVLVWTLFIQNILEFSSYLKDWGIDCEYIYGATPIEKDDQLEDLKTRESIIREFHSSGSKFKVLLANPFAIAESISLHKACHDAIYLDRNFNAGTFIQSKDRIHRYGLPPDAITQYYYLLSDNNLDRTIDQRLEFKENRMVEIIEKEPIPLFSMMESEDYDYEDLRQLVRNYAKS